MPIYEYRCNGCEARFEALVRVADRDRPQACPECGSEETERQLSTFAMGGGGSGSGLSASATPACGKGFR